MLQVLVVKELHTVKAARRLFFCINDCDQLLRKRSCDGYQCWPSGEPKDASGELSGKDAVRGTPLVWVTPGNRFLTRARAGGPGYSRGLLRYVRLTCVTREGVRLRWLICNWATRRG